MELEIVVVFCSSSLFITASANNAAGDNDAEENSEKNWSSQKWTFCYFADIFLWEEATMYGKNFG